MKNEKESGTRTKMDLVTEDIMATCIPNMLKLLYGIADAMMILAYEIDKQIRYIYLKHGIPAKHGFAESDLKGLGEYVKAAKSMSYWFDRSIEPRIQSSTVNENNEFDIELYDHYHSDSNWLLRAICYCIDRQANHEGILDNIKRLKKPNPCIIDEEIIEKFRQK